ncbi:MAG: BamA/TamA family outer membrane protein [Gemmatimonadota bacterium]|nr:BamA/TamA family outer membrane protein [Gemmatimonadota bacterium]
MQSSQQSIMRNPVCPAAGVPGLALLMVLVFAAGLSAQFVEFGKNKVQYSDFDWRILAGEHVDLYYYPEEEEIAYLALKEAEEVYKKHSLRFNHHVFRRIPLILYSAHHYFQQTNITWGFVPEGVGGFTEFLKGRVALPFNGSFEDFRHVLDHELVHVFQISKANQVYRAYPRRTKARMPLWWTEGLAEYFSTYWSADSDLHVRDLMLNNMVPPLKKLDMYAGSGIIYKLGEDVLRLLGQRYGDEMIVRMYENLWQFPEFSQLFEYVYGISLDDFSNIWHHELKKRYYPDVLEKDELKISGRIPIATKSWANIHPSVYTSPKSGKQRVVFVSPRTGYLDIYSVLMEKGEKGRKKHIKGGRCAEYESFHPFQTRFDVGANGVMLFSSKFYDKDALFLFDLDRNRKVARYRFKGLVGINAPAWGPLQKRVVFSGLSISGFSDIYLYDLESEKLTRLTNDRYSDNYPDFSPDGRYVVFSSDRTVYGKKGSRNLFLYDMQTGRIKYLTMGEWKDSQPRFSAAGDRVAFISDRNGVPNIYAVNMEGEGSQLTNFFNGLFGFDWTRADSGFCFTSLDKHSMGIYYLDVPGTRVDTVSLDRETRAVQWEWEDFREHAQSKKAEKRPYKRDFTLDFAYGEVGYNPSPYYGGTFGQALFMFSDLMSDELILLAAGNSATSSADFWDSFSGYLTYYNRKNRLKYGYGAFRFAGCFVDFRRDELYYERDHGIYGMLSYPLSKFLRIETGMGLMKSYREDYILDFVRDSYLVTNSVSLIKDTSLFLQYGPIDGERIHLGMALTSDLSKGRTDNITLLADFRKYFRLTTFTAYAVRLQGRYSSGKIPYRYIMGGSWTLRGYRRWSIIGSRSILFNQEIRFPLFHQLDVHLGIGRLPLPGIQGALFFDMGNAWEKGEKYPGLLASTGFGFRMSLGGPLILRLDRARRILWLKNRAEKIRFSQRWYTNFFFGFDY